MGKQAKMKILVTSGGTKVPIDMVRSITNMSRGTFGSKIARQLLIRGGSQISMLTYLGAKEFRMPFSIHDPDIHTRGVGAICREVVYLAGLHEEHKDRYTQCTYKTFDQYATRLRELIEHDKPDLVILAAAVSDYIVPNPVDGKVRSSEDLKIDLAPAEKLIGRVKEWHPDCKLVGFKLLVNSNRQELEAAAKDSLAKNKCELVVANDLRDIKAGEHQLLLVSPASICQFKTDPNDPDFLASVVADYSLRTMRRT